MCDAPHKRMEYVTEALETDREYLWLRSRRDAVAEQMSAICSRLSSEERAVLLEYWGISQEMMLRMVEIACFIDVL